LGVSYPELRMPMETRYYVPKLQAIKNIVSNPMAFGATLPMIGNHPYFQSVPITRDIDVALAARLADVALEDFKALNPSAKNPVILAAGTPQILLPWDNAAVFQSKLDTYTGGPLASWTVWVSPATLKPADVAKRVGMSEGDLRSVNHIPPRVLIKAGSALLVPRSGRVLLDVTEHLADNGQLSLSPEASRKRGKTVTRAHAKSNGSVKLAKSKSKSTGSVRVAKRGKAVKGKAIKVAKR
jgi:membrane-bound lytic murein transglycosylase D